MAWVRHAAGENAAVEAHHEAALKALHGFSRRKKAAGAGEGARQSSPTSEL
jgi:hypothetical protein